MPAPEVSMAAEIWEAAKTAGPFGNLLLLAILVAVDKERRKYRDERQALLREVLDTFNAGTGASKDMSRALANFMRGRYATTPGADD